MKTLDSKITSEANEKLANGVSLKKIVADAVSSNLFCAGTAVLSEVILAGMDTTEYVRSRLLNVLPNALSGSVYGKWRDYMQDRFKSIEEKGKFGKFLLDSMISGTFSLAYLPIYFGVMAAAGAEMDEMLKAAGGSVFNSVITGPIIGYTTDKVRQIVGVRKSLSEPTLENEKDTEIIYINVDDDVEMPEYADEIGQVA